MTDERLFDPQAVKALRDGFIAAQPHARTAKGRETVRAAAAKRFPLVQRTVWVSPITGFKYRVVGDRVEWSKGGFGWQHWLTLEQWRDHTASIERELFARPVEPAPDQKL